MNKRGLTPSWESAPPHLPPPVLRWDTLILGGGTVILCHSQRGGISKKTEKQEDKKTRPPPHTRPLDGDAFFQVVSTHLSQQTERLSAPASEEEVMSWRAEALRDEAEIKGDVVTC